MTDCVNVCGTGGWSGPLPGDPDNNVLLSAVPAFGGIDVSWTYPAINPFAVAHVLLYRGISANYNSSRLLQVVSGNFFYDKVDGGPTYYYWISIVSVNGTVGELIGPASGTARPFISDLLGHLTGQIDAGALAQSLKGTLDNISIVNSNLTAEIFDRQTGETSLAQALDDVQAGVAQANTFIATEIASRTSANTAIAEQINLVASTLGSNVAAVSTSLTTAIDDVSGAVNAMYTAKVTVNDLIGGFGLSNNGKQVEAGFDVDTFWVGRTGANKRKPFMVVGNETFIDQAVIRSLTFNKLRDEAGSFIVENGKIKADYIVAKEINVGSFTSYAWPANGQGGAHISKDGLLLGNAFSGNYFQIAANGDVRSPGFDTTGGVMTLKALNVVKTVNIAGENVVVARGASAPDYTNPATSYVTVLNVDMDSEGQPIQLTGGFVADWTSSGGNGGTYCYMRLVRDNSVVIKEWRGRLLQQYAFFMYPTTQHSPPPGNHTYSLQAMVSAVGDNSLSIAALRNPSLHIMGLKR